MSTKTTEEIATALREHGVDPLHFRLTVAAVLVAFAETIPQACRNLPDLATIVDPARIVEHYGMLAQAVARNEPNTATQPLIRRTLEHLAGLLEERNEP